MRGAKGLNDAMEILVDLKYEDEEEEQQWTCYICTRGVSPMR